MNTVEVQRRRKRIMLLEDLKDHVKCPVCLEVPRSGPIYSCPNGHHVCQKCKQRTCPLCRAVMGDHKSLLAVEIIENILHKCKFVECEYKFPLGEELAGHERNCKHRIVTCPGSHCDEKFALTNLSEHRGKKTCSSFAEPIVIDETTATADQNYFSDINCLKDKQINWDIDWFSYKGIQLALCVNKSGGLYHFYIVMFESEDVCAGYVVEMEVCKKYSPQESRNYLKFRGNPVSVDTPKSDIETFGLTVHHKAMEKMVLEGDVFKFTVSFSFV